MRNLVFCITVASLFIAMHCLYQRGLQDGEQRYKASHRMYMALKSSYTFGYWDCQEGRTNDYDD